MKQLRPRLPEDDRNLMPESAGEQYLRLGRRPGPRPPLEFDLLVRNMPHVDAVEECPGEIPERRERSLVLAFVVVRGTALIASASACLARSSPSPDGDGPQRAIAAAIDAGGEPEEDRTPTDIAIRNALADISFKAQAEWQVGTGDQFDLRVSSRHLATAAADPLGLARVEAMPETFDQVAPGRLGARTAREGHAYGVRTVDHVVEELGAWFERSYNAEDGWEPGHTGLKRTIEALRLIVADSNRDLFDEHPEPYAAYKRLLVMKAPSRAPDAA